MSFRSQVRIFRAEPGDNDRKRAERGLFIYENYDVDHNSIAPGTISLILLSSINYFILTRKLI